MKAALEGRAQAARQFRKLARSLTGSILPRAIDAELKALAREVASASRDESPGGLADRVTVEKADLRGDSCSGVVAVERADLGRAPGRSALNPRVFVVGVARRAGPRSIERAARSIASETEKAAGG